MTPHNKKLLLCSTLKATKKAKVNGILDLKILYLINIINGFLDKCDPIEFKQYRQLKSLVTTLKNRNKIFYNEKDIKAHKSVKYCKDCKDQVYNKPNEIIPIVNNNSTILEENIYQFKFTDFTKNFNSFGNGGPKFVRIDSLPTQGKIKYNNIDIIEGFIFDITNINNLIYDLEGMVGPQIFSFNFRTSNNNINTKFSNMATFTINVDAQVNLPPSAVGDNSITIHHSTTKVFTSADFTTNTTPMYADPEGDAAFELRITTLPLSGTLKYNNIAVTISQIIPFTGIDAGNLIYESDGSNNSAYNVAFNFEVSDAGSQQFVS